MVQFSPATREARVRFPADAYVLFLIPILYSAKNEDSNFIKVTLSENNELVI